MHEIRYWNMPAPISVWTDFRMIPPNRLAFWVIDRKVMAWNALGRFIALEYIASSTDIVEPR